MPDCLAVENHNDFLSLVSAVATTNSNYRQNIYESRNMVFTFEKNDTNYVIEYKILSILTRLSTSSNFDFLNWKVQVS